MRAQNIHKTPHVQITYVNVVAIGLEATRSETRQSHYQQEAKEGDFVEGYPLAGSRQLAGQ